MGTAAFSISCRRSSIAYATPESRGAGLLGLTLGASRGAVRAVGGARMLPVNLQIHRTAIARGGHDTDMLRLPTPLPI